MNKLVGLINSLERLENRIINKYSPIPPDNFDEDSIEIPFEIVSATENSIQNIFHKLGFFPKSGTVCEYMESVEVIDSLARPVGYLINEGHITAPKPGLLENALRKARKDYRDKPSEENLKELSCIKVYQKVLTKIS